MADPDGVPLSKEVLHEARQFLNESKAQFLASHKQPSGQRNSLVFEGKLQGYAILNRIVSFCENNVQLVMQTELSDQNSDLGGQAFRSSVGKDVRGPPGMTTPDENQRQGDMNLRNVERENVQLKEKVKALQDQVQKFRDISTELYRLYDRMTSRFVDIEKKYSRSITSLLSGTEAFNFAADNKLSANIGQEQLALITGSYRDLSFTEATKLKKTLTKPKDIASNIWHYFTSVLICTTFKVSYTQLRQIRRQMLTSLLQCLNQPICNVKGCSNLQATGETAHFDSNGPNVVDTSIPAEMNQALNHFLQHRADQLQTDCLVEDVIDSTLAEAMTKIEESYIGETLTKQELQKMYKPFTVKRDGTPTANRTHLRSFVTSVCRLCWRMVIQQPPMSLIIPVSGERYLNISDEFECLPLSGKGSLNQTQLDELVVEYSLEPCLMQQDRIVHKGRVAVTTPVP